MQIPLRNSVVGFRGFCKFFNLKTEPVFTLCKTNFSSLYHSFSIPKKDGTQRIIDSPDDSLKQIQKIISYKLAKIYKPPKCVYGFVVDKDIKKNAFVHLKRNTYVVHFDIKDFFPSITSNRIYGLAAKALGFDKTAASLFVKFVTYNNYLPQGSPCSPILSNMICQRLDKDLSRLIHNFSISYTRYADDMVFSSNLAEAILNPNLLLKFDNERYQASDRLSLIMAQNGFSLNDRKTNLRTKSNSQKVTGLVINEKVNVNHRFIKDLRRSMFLFKKYQNGSINQIAGKVCFLRYIRGNDDILANKYSCELNSLGKSYYPEADFLLDNNFSAEKKYIGFVKSQTDFGTCFFSNGFIITSDHVIHDKNAPLPKQIQITLWEENLPHSIDMQIVSFNIVNREILILKVNDFRPFENRQLKICKEAAKINEFVNAYGYLSDPIFGSIPTDSGALPIRKIDTRFYCKCGILDKDRIYKGMSGGPVLNKNKEVVGVCYMGRSLDDSEELEAGSSTNQDSLFSMISMDTLYYAMLQNMSKSSF